MTLPDWLNLDMDMYLSRIGQEFSRTTMPDGQVRYRLAHCPFNPEHQGADAALFQDPITGRVGFHCFHDSCQGKTWGEVFDLWDYPNLRECHIERPVRAKRFEAAPEGESPYSMEIMTWDEFMAKDFAFDWLIEGVMVENQPLVIAGPQKTLKTSIMLDAAISIATGAPFLEVFPVPEPKPVMMISGELGGLALQATQRRIFDVKVENARLRGEVLVPDYYISVKLPALSFKSHLEVISREIENRGIKLCILDPAYLSILKGASSKLAASNLFDMGPILSAFGEICMEHACTPAVIHHMRKREGHHRGTEPPSLESMSYSGFAEWARQWLLLGRRERFNPKKAQHALYMSAGGSVGHSGEWAVHVDEGVPVVKNFEGRIWDVQVMDLEDVLQEEEEEEENSVYHQVLEVLDDPEGLTQTAIKKRIGTINPTRLKEVLHEMVAMVGFTSSRCCRTPSTSSPKKSTSRKGAR